MLCIVKTERIVTSLDAETIFDSRSEQVSTDYFDDLKLAKFFYECECDCKQYAQMKNASKCVKTLHSHNLVELWCDNKLLVSQSFDYDF